MNKRTSRLAANMPFVANNLCPLSFVDVPERAYVEAVMGVYELMRPDLLADLFVWAYERSCQRYVVVRDSTAEPDPFRMRYRGALIEVIGGIVRNATEPTPQLIRERAAALVEPRDLDRFVDMARQDFSRLYEGNVARYRLRLAEYERWKQVTTPIDALPRH